MDHGQTSNKYDYLSHDKVATTNGQSYQLILQDTWNVNWSIRTDGRTDEQTDEGSCEAWFLHQNFSTKLKFLAANLREMANFLWNSKGEFTMRELDPKRGDFHSSTFSPLSSGSKFFAQHKKPPLLVKYNWKQSECVISDKSYESMLTLAENPIFGPFSATGPPVPARYHACLSWYAKSEKSNDSNSRKWLKTHRFGKIWAHFVQLGPRNYFFEQHISTVSFNKFGNESAWG